jgi:hypothetical protein
MANHQQWQDLTIIEKIDLVGKLTHLLQNDIISYQVFKAHIKLSELAGLFDEVKINTTNEGNS